jgi:hypothetical protein
MNDIQHVGTWWFTAPKRVAEIQTYLGVVDIQIVGVASLGFVFIHDIPINVYEYKIDR